MIKVVTIVGARPQFIKCASISRVLRPVAREVLVHTGQHYDDNMSNVFFQELGIPKPDYNLDVRSGPHGEQTAAMLAGIERVLLKEAPDVVLVYGDTNSTLAGALAAAKLNIPVAHIEAGLRSFHRSMPEELNRVITDHISARLFCPTQTAVDNLSKEGILNGVELVGDVMEDALCHNIAVARRVSTVLQRMNLSPKHYLLATVHRAENVHDPLRMQAIADGLMAVASSVCPVVFPMHPGTRKTFERQGTSLKSPGLLILDPVSYIDMLALEDNARTIVTDSGGVQKEAFWLSVPCITVRDETEWIETVETGSNVLVGADARKIYEHARINSQLTPRPRPRKHGKMVSQDIVNLLLN